MARPIPKEGQEYIPEVSAKPINHTNLQEEKVTDLKEKKVLVNPVELANQSVNKEEEVNKDLEPEDINKNLEASDLLPSAEVEVSSVEAEPETQVGITVLEQEEAVELKEFSQPLAQAPLPKQLAVNTIIVTTERKSYRIVKWLRNESQANLYAAISKDGQSVWVKEAFCETDTAARFFHEARVLQGLNCPMFPQVSGCFKSKGKAYLITEEISTERGTFADLLRSKERQLSDILLVLAQVALGLKQLHKHGYAHLGLRPTHIILGKPVKILDSSYATRIGEKPTVPFAHAGYSPPELQVQEPVDERADIYAVGALLYQAVKGEKIPETGPELTLLPPIAGVRQILIHCLGDRNSRYQTMANLHQDLLRLRQHLQTTLNYSVAAATTIGLESTRTTNQDAYGYLTGHLTSEQGEHTWIVACVSDGMGGMAAGEVASDSAVKVVLREAATTFTESNKVSLANQVQSVKQWVREANQNVCKALKRHQAEGGCTLVCACLVNRKLAISHVGDCRIYHFREGEAKPLLLTRDHSLVMARVLQGELKPEEVRHHPDRSIVTRSLGDRHPLPDYYIDTLETATSQPFMELQGGDILLLCSDGLWEPVLEVEMLQVLQDYAPNLQATANALLQIALQRGASDNATVVLLRLDENDVPKEG